MTRPAGVRFRLTPRFAAAGLGLLVVASDFEFRRRDVNQATSGAIDDTAMFYLRSRGVPKQAATDLLVLAFLAEALDEIADDRLAEDLRGRLEGWLARRRR